MIALKSSPIAFQSDQIAYWSATSGGSILAGLFSNPVKSKMRATPSQKGLRRLRSMIILRLCFAVIRSLDQSLPNAIIARSASTATTAATADALS